MMCSVECSFYLKKFITAFGHPCKAAFRVHYSLHLEGDDELFEYLHSFW